MVRRIKTQNSFWKPQTPRPLDNQLSRPEKKAQDFEQLEKQTTMGKHYPGRPPAAAPLCFSMFTVVKRRGDAHAQFCGNFLENCCCHYFPLKCKVSAFDKIVN